MPKLAVLKDCEHPGQLFHTLFDEYSVKIYTDGSKIKHGTSVGTSSVCPEINLVKTNSVNSTALIYTVECLALVDAMHLAVEYRDRNVDIFTDSLSAVLSLSGPLINLTNFLLLEILKKNYEFYNNNPAGTKLIVHWIPSHVGICGNAQADEAAKGATKENPHTLLAIPYADLKPLFDEIMSVDNDKQLQRDGLYKGCQYLNRLYKSSSKPRFYGLYLAREEFLFRGAAAIISLSTSP